MISLSVDTDGLTGKTFDKSASELQSDIEIGENSISGTLKYVTDYQAYLGDEQNGNFIALHVVPANGATVTAELIGGVHGPVTLDEDNVVIFRVTSTSQKIKFAATKNGITSTYIYSLNGVTLQGAA